MLYTSCSWRLFVTGIIIPIETSQIQQNKTFMTVVGCGEDLFELPIVQGVSDLSLYSITK